VTRASRATAAVVRAADELLTLAASPMSAGATQQKRGASRRRVEK
jgi:hypothetical protein